MTNEGSHTSNLDAAPSEQAEAKESEVKIGDQVVDPAVLDYLKADQSPETAQAEAHADLANIIAPAEFTGQAEGEGSSKTEYGARVDASDGVVKEALQGGPTSRTIEAPKKVQDVSWWGDAMGENPIENPLIDVRGAGKNSVVDKLDRGARESEVDYHTTHGEKIQVDDGRGALSVATVYDQRVREQAKNGDLKPDETRYVCAVGDNDKDLRDIMHHIRQRDAEDREASGDKGVDVASRTKAVLYCSEQRAEMLRNAQVEDNEPIEVRGFDLSKPGDIQLPENTMAVIVSGATNQLETHPIAKLPGKEKEPRSEGDQGNRIVKSWSRITGPAPLPVVDTESGRVSSIQSSDWLRKDSHKTADSDPAKLNKFLPQLMGRWVVLEGGTRLDSPPYKDTTLYRKELDVRNAVKDRKPLEIYNYSPDSEALTKKITESIRPDGIAVIAGVMREDPSQPLHLAALVHQQRIPIVGEKDDRFMPVSPIRHRVSEAAGIRKAAAAADDKARVFSVCDETPGKYGYVVIDRAKDGAAKTEEVMRKDLAVPIQKIDDFASGMRQAIEIAQMGGDANSAATAENIRKRLDNDPIWGRSYEMQLRMSHIFKEAGMHQEAKHYASKAAELIPTASAPLIELAKADIEQVRADIQQAEANIQQAKADNKPVSADIQQAIADRVANNINIAQQNLERARALSPQFDLIYKLGTEVAQLQGNTEAEVANRLEYLRTAVQSPQDTIRNLTDLCGAMQRNCENHKDDTTTFKTVVVHNVVTDEYRPLEIPKSMAVRMQAADTAMDARDVVQELFAYDNQVTGQEIDETLERFNQIWEATRITEADAAFAANASLEQLLVRRPDLSKEEATELLSRFTNYGPLLQTDQPSNAPLNRDLWPDRAAPECRLIYDGNLAQGDNVVPPIETRNFLDSLDTKESHDAASELHTSMAERTLESTTIVGNVVEIDGTSGGTMALPTFIMGNNGMVYGRTGVGKTTFTESQVEQLPATGARFTLMDLSAKNGLAETAVRLNAKGIPVTRIEPGNPNAPPISVDIMSPLNKEDPAGHIDLVIEIWKTAYNMPDPFPSVLRIGLENVYAKNGWKITTEAMRNGSPSHRILDEPTVPTTDELQTACMEAAAHYTTGDAANIKNFFKTRGQELKTSGVQPFLEPRNSDALDWRRHVNTNSLVNLSYIKDERIRRFMASAYTMLHNEAIRQRRAEEIQQGIVTKGMRNLLWLDEASLLLRAGAEEGARQEASANLANQLRTMREEGMGTVANNQTVDDTNPVAVSQAGFSAVFSITSGNDQKAVQENEGLTDDQVARLKTLPAGQMFLWKQGMERPVRVAVRMSTPPPKEAMDAARQHYVMPPVKRATASKAPYTLTERREAQIEAQKADWDWMRHVVFSVTTAHTAKEELPSKVPEPVKEQVRTMSATPDGRRKLELTIDTIVRNAVEERKHAIASDYNPDSLHASVRAHTIALIDGKEPMGPNRHPSPHYSSRYTVVAKQLGSLTTPHWKKPPQKDSLAPINPGIPNIPTDPRQTVEQQVEALKNHPDSPYYDKENGVRAWQAILGSLPVQSVWRDLKTATSSADGLRDRRQVAVALGYLDDEHHPDASGYERILALPGAILAQYQEVD